MVILNKIEELARKYAEGMDEEIIKQFAEIVNDLIKNKLVEIQVTEKKIETEGDFIKLVQSVKLKFTGQEELDTLRLITQNQSETIKDLENRVWEVLGQKYKLEKQVETLQEMMGRY